MVLGQSYDMTYDNLTRNLKIFCKLGPSAISSLIVADWSIALQFTEFHRIPALKFQWFNICHSLHL